MILGRGKQQISVMVTNPALSFLPALNFVSPDVSVCRRKKTKDVPGDFSQEGQPRPGWMVSPFGQRRAIAGGCGILDISSLGT